MIGLFYASKYGFTKKVITMINNQCNQPSMIVDLDDKDQDIDSILMLSDKIVVGGPIYNGEILKSVTDFLVDYKDELLQKDLVLFISALQRKEIIQIEMDQNFPLALLDHAKLVTCLGGALDYDSLSWIDRVITTKSLKISKNMEKLEQHSINQITAWCNQTST